MPRHNGRRRFGATAGFTLIELIATLAVMSIVMLLLAQGLQFGRLASARQTRALAFSHEGDIEAIDRLLRRLLGQIDAGGKYGLATDFAGDAHRVSFTAFLPAPPPGLASAEADMALTATPGTGLTLTWRPHVRRPLNGGLPASQERLQANIVRLDLNYAGQDARWRDEWHQTDLPRLIRLHFVSQSGMPLPDLVIAPERTRWHP